MVIPSAGTLTLTENEAVAEGLPSLETVTVALPGTDGFAVNTPSGETSKISGLSDVKISLTLTASDGEKVVSSACVCPTVISVTGFVTEILWILSSVTTTLQEACLVWFSSLMT